MGKQLRQIVEQRKDKRAAKSGLMVEINRQTYPVLNFSTGGLLIGEAGFGFVTGKKVFLTLFHISKPSDKAFLYGYTAWLDIFQKVVGFDFAKPSEHANQFLENLLTSTARRRPASTSAKSGGWIGRLLK